MKTYKFRLDSRAKDVPEYMRTFEAIYVTRADVPGIKLAPNRKLKMARVARMTADMDNGRWDSEVPNVAWFNLANEASNIQHRLTALGRSKNIPGIWLVKVTTKCDPSTAPDQIPRSVADAFRMRGVQNATEAVGMLGLIHRARDVGLPELIASMRNRRHGKSRHANTAAQFADLWPVYQKHKTLIDADVAEACAFIRHARNTRGVTAITATDLAFGFWVARESPMRDAKDILKRLVIATRADAFKRDEPKVGKAFTAIMASHRRNRFGNGGSTERLSWALELIAA